MSWWLCGTAVVATVVWQLCNVAAVTAVASQLCDVAVVAWHSSNHVMLMCYDSTPIFPLFSLTWLHVPLVSHATYPVHPACASKSQVSSSLTLHSRASSFLPTFSFGSLWRCRDFLSRSSDSFVYSSLVPFSYYTPSPFSTLPDPRQCHRYITFHLHQEPYASFPDPVLYLASFTVSPFIPSFRLRPSPVYKPLSRRLCLLSLTWSLIRVLFRAPTVPLCVPLFKGTLNLSAA